MPILIKFGYEQLKNFHQLLQYQLEAVHRKFETIYPIHRSKRGLINALGSIIKTISGNLDNEDAERYNKAILALQNNQKNIIREVNRHMSLTKKLIDNFNTTTTLIRHNQEILAKEINSLKSELENYFYETSQYIRVRTVMDQLSLSLQIVFQLLTDLESAVTFAKLNILHSSIIKVGEMQTIIQTLLENHSKEQLLYIKEEDLAMYYDVISVDAYYSNAMIVFILHLPLLHPEKFTHYHLYSIPTSNFTTIIPPSPYLTMNSALYQYSDVPCRKIRSIYLCPIKSIRFQDKIQDCVVEIFQLADREARCHYIPVSVNSTLIEELTKSSYIGIFPEPTKIYSQCVTSSISDVHGTYLIELPPGCNFKTPTDNYINSEDFSEEQPLLLPKIKTAQINHKENRKPIKLEKIPLDELHKIQQEEQLQSLVYEGPIDSTHFWTTPLFIFVAATIGFGCYKCHHRLRQIKKSQEEAKKKVLFVPYTTSSGDGEVTEA